MLGGGVSSLFEVCTWQGWGGQQSRMTMAPGGTCVCGSWCRLEFPIDVCSGRLRSWDSLGMEYRAEAWGGGPTTGSLRFLGPPLHPLPLGINKVGSRAYLRSRVSIGVQQGGIMLPVAEMSRRRRSGRPSRMARLTGFSCPFEDPDPLPFAHMYMS